jgi:hypothetical protein
MSAIARLYVDPENGVSLFSAGIDPTAGSGVTAPIGSLLVRSDTGTGYTKTGSAATAWTSLASTGGITQTFADGRYLQLIGGTLTGKLELSGGPSWTASGWVKMARLGSIGAIEFSGSPVHWGIGNSGGTLYMFTTAVEDTSAALVYQMYITTSLASFALPLSIGGFLQVNGHSLIQSTVNSEFLLTNSAGTDFNLLRFGGVTASFPAIRRSGAALDVILADASAWAIVNAHSLALQSGGITMPGTAAITRDGQGLIHQAATSGATVYEEWRNSAGTRRGFVGYGATSSSTLYLFNDEANGILLGASGSTVASFTTSLTQLYTRVLLSEYVSIASSYGMYARVNSTSYSSGATLMLREALLDAGVHTTADYAPRLVFHWGGVIASQISIELDGAIAIRNNPGTDYEGFKASTIHAFSDATLDGYTYINTGTNFGKGLVGNYDPTKYRLIYAMGTSYLPAAGGSSLSSMYGLVFSYSDGTTSYPQWSGTVSFGHGLGGVFGGVKKWFAGELGFWHAGFGRIDGTLTVGGAATFNTSITVTGAAGITSTKFVDSVSGAQIVPSIIHTFAPTSESAPDGTLWGVI